MQPPSFWRIKKSQKWMKLYIFQHLYMPLAYSLVSIIIGCGQSKLLAECLSIPNHYTHTIILLQLAIKFRAEDFLFVYKSRRSMFINHLHVSSYGILGTINCAGQIRMNPLTTVQWTMFWTGKIVHCLACSSMLCHTSTYRFGIW